MVYKPADGVRSYPCYHVIKSPNTHSGHNIFQPAAIPLHLVTYSDVRNRPTAQGSWLLAFTAPLHLETTCPHRDIGRCAEHYAVRLRRQPHHTSTSTHTFCLWYLQLGLVTDSQFSFKPDHLMMENWFLYAEQTTPIGLPLFCNATKRSGLCALDHPSLSLSTSASCRLWQCIMHAKLARLVTCSLAGSRRSRTTLEEN